MSRRTQIAPMRAPARTFLRALLPASLAIALAACGGGDDAAQGDGTPEVTVTEARAADAETALVLPARAVAGETARLYARATGFVGERNVDIGDRVAAGEVLATITDPEGDQSVRQLAAERDRARAALALAVTNFERAAKLVESQAISRELFSDRQAARDAAQADLGAAEAQLASARERQGFQSVRAPFAGVVSARNVERGDRVVGDGASDAPMFQVDALDPLRIVADVPQSAALQVRPGTKADVVFRELPGEAMAATVVRSAGRISDEAGGMRVELDLPNPDGRIPAGMVGELRLRVPRAAPVVVVPLAAVVAGGGGQSQVVVVGADSKVAFRPVQVGANRGGELELVSGIEPGTRLVLAPNALLAEGATVRVRPPAEPGTAAKPGGGSGQAASGP